MQSIITINGKKQHIAAARVHCKSTSSLPKAVASVHYTSTTPPNSHTPCLTIPQSSKTNVLNESGEALPILTSPILATTTTTVTAVAVTTAVAAAAATQPVGAISPTLTANERDFIKPCWPPPLPPPKPRPPPPPPLPPRRLSRLPSVRVRHGTAAERDLLPAAPK